MFPGLYAGALVRVLVDAGAEASCLSLSFVEKIEIAVAPASSPSSIVTVNGEEALLQVQCVLPLTIMPFNSMVSFDVVPLSSSFDVRATATVWRMGRRPQQRRLWWSESPHG